MTQDEAEMIIVEAVTRAMIIIKGAFNLTPDETDNLIDVIYSKLAEYSDRRRNDARVK